MSYKRWRALWLTFLVTFSPTLVILITWTATFAGFNLMSTLAHEITLFASGLTALIGVCLLLWATMASESEL